MKGQAVCQHSGECSSELHCTPGSVEQKGAASPPQCSLPVPTGCQAAWPAVLSELNSQPGGVVPWKWGWDGHLLCELGVEAGLLLLPACIAEHCWLEEPLQMEALAPHPSQGTLQVLTG